MSNLSEMQSYQPNYYLEITEMQEILKADDTKLIELNYALDDVWKNAYVETLTQIGANRWEEILGITHDETRALEEQKSLIVSVIRGTQKLNSTRIKEIAIAYENGEVEVLFEDSTIKITYSSLLGVPGNFKDFEGVIEQRKPAHLMLEFIFKYNLVESLANKPILVGTIANANITTKELLTYEF